MPEPVVSPGPESTRLAPTPSGFLHAGNAVNFLLTDRLARRAGASLRLRIDDLDAERERPTYVQDIFEGLAWLGIRPDVGPRDAEDHRLHGSQQLRIPRYRELADALRSAGEVYACGCSRQQRATLLAAGVTTCGCRTAGSDLDDGTLAWRVRIPEDAEVTVHGLFGPARSERPFAWLPDPVVMLRAQDGRPRRPAYQLASLADDVDHDITFIVRGEDLFPSTLVQLHLARVLGLSAFAAVRFLHHPLLTDDRGAKLSKSEGATSLRAMRLAGHGPQTLIAEADAMLRQLAAGA
ncbi:MAG: tRNA glutamyl-Q synthetase [Flavobacteriales bacterium]|nr:tRNA glutamyl-Q synthetase [Flavobacteriales bacterium]MBK8950514.1 tRNA glutamyl-Q synthetase [Flavobacteriales bacterium]MBK9699640.1 tRNA glutamyl-Q synthetase [Flavobacteriales bacterium]